MEINTNMINGYKVRRQKFSIFALILMVVIGAAMLGGGILALQGERIDPTWTKVSGQTTSVKSTIDSSGHNLYTAVVSYQVNGQSYTIAAGSSSSIYPRIGGTKQVAYNPQAPANAKAIDGGALQLFLWIFPIIGVLFLILSPILYVRSLKRSNAIKNLVQSGQKLPGVLVDVRSMGSPDNQVTFKIVVAATDPQGTVQNYTSDTMTGIGGLAMVNFRESPIPIDVYVDPGDPSKYYVDVSDIPNLTPDRIAELLKSAVSHVAAGARGESIVPAETYPAPFMPSQPMQAPITREEPNTMPPDAVAQPAPTEQPPTDPSRPY
jgi:hypothetical protein